jgi:hypothetical protein
MADDSEAVAGKKTADIADFDTIAASEEGSVMEVRNPKTGEVLRHDDGRPFTITFRGKDSEAFRNLARAQSDRRISANMRTRAPVLTAVIERDDIELIVAATLKWDIVLGGTAAKSDPKEYRSAYTKYPWLKEQGDEFVGVRANFIKS